MFKAIGLIILLVALKVMFAEVFDAAEVFMQTFFEYGTEVLEASAPR